MATEQKETKPKTAKAKADAQGAAELANRHDVDPGFGVKELAKDAQRVRAALKKADNPDSVESAQNDLQELIEKHSDLLKYNGISEEDRKFARDHRAVLISLK